MKVFSGMFWHETSSFSPLPTGWQDYRNTLLYRPSTGEGAEAWAQKQMMAPLAALSRQRGHNVIEGLAALTTPSGLTPKPVYEALRAELLEDLTRAGPVDAVLLFMHGSQMAEGCDDCEGDILARIRAIVGPEIFIGVLLDLHCNITPAMALAANALVPCKEYPHTDWPDRSLDLVRMAEYAITKGLRPRTLFHPVPMLGIFHTNQPALRTLVDEMTAMEGAGGILAANLAHGFPLGDQAATGAGILLVVDQPDAGHQALARTLAHRFFAIGRETSRSYPNLDAAIDEVERALTLGAEKPIVFADTADNPGGGAPGDSTFVLRALLERGLRHAAIGAVWDPGAAQIAASAGPGARLALRVGGKLGPLSGVPLDLDVEVLAIIPDHSQTSFVPGVRVAMGLTAAVRCGGIDIVITSLRQQTLGTDLFSGAGIDLAAKKLIVVKSAHHFHAKFAPIASQVIYCAGPGYASKAFFELPYTKLARPIWPLDPAPFDAHGETWG
jgi:microcystin degradation protein MlrC